MSARDLLVSEEDRRAIDRELGLLLSGGATTPGILPLEDHGALWSALARSAEGGKRFRPALLIAAHHALGGVRHNAAFQVGAAIELLHTAFVVQDDVIDGDRMRRGVPNLSGAFAQRARCHGASPAGAERYGEAAGILAGDLGLLAAARAIVRCQAPPPVVDRLLDLLETTVHASAAGELADVRLQLDLTPSSAPLRDALRVAELKTAVYSFQLPLHAGALLADASEEVLTALDEIGGLLGIGFQLFDDLLGIFGDEQRTGKSALGDLREGKRTVLLAHASSTPVWPRLRPLIGRADLDAVGARRARDLLVESGSRAWTEDLGCWHLRSAIEAATRHRLPPALTQALTATTTEILAVAESALSPAPEAAPAAPEPDRAGQLA
ncbi:polyprenyl synthetase family protein [Brachybacterium sp. YJGR34]|uniref:polyprenyl synthetase family protein n=1 Tax=Brachybacterium sp. YJGR34 TaxID=2059911 RepID=UPI001E3995CA|nr:polyprenyl synthetase family protein [Brachybacterium sp. YJGR34]